MRKPVFLSLDGLDGTGKSTQVRLLVEWLRAAGVPVTACIDPGGTDIGAKLREILLFGRSTQISPRTEALLFMASRAELVDQVIRPALARNEVVVSDRYLLANVVYQGHAGGLSPTDLWAVGDFCTGGLLPDLTIVFDLPPEEARARRNRDADRMESRGIEYDRKVREGFQAESHRTPDRIKLVAADGSADEVHARVRELVAPLLHRHGHALPEG